MYMYVYTGTLWWLATTATHSLFSVCQTVHHHVYRVTSHGCSSYSVCHTYTHTSQLLLWLTLSQSVACTMYVIHLSCYQWLTLSQSAVCTYVYTSQLLPVTHSVSVCRMYNVCIYIYISAATSDSLSLSLSYVQCTYIHLSCYQWLTLSQSAGGWPWSGITSPPETWSSVSLSGESPDWSATQ